MLHDRLQSQGVRCWLDEHQLVPGDDLHGKGSVLSINKIWSERGVYSGTNYVCSPFIMEREIRAGSMKGDVRLAEIR